MRLPIPLPLLLFVGTRLFLLPFLTSPPELYSYAPQVQPFWLVEFLTVKFPSQYEFRLGNSSIYQNFKLVDSDNIPQCAV